MDVLTTGTSTGARKASATPRVRNGAAITNLVIPGAISRSSSQRPAPTASTFNTESGVWFLRTTAAVAINDDMRPSVTQIVNNAVAQCRAETTGSEYDMALWLHDWVLDQLEHDHSLN